MSDERLEHEIREVLIAAHERARDRAPEFGALWSRAADQTGNRRPQRRNRLLVAAAAVVVVLTTTIGIWLANRRSQAEIERAMVMAGALNEWQAPLDFLLETPGRAWLETTPRWDLELATEPLGLPRDLLQEVSQ